MDRKETCSRQKQQNTFDKRHNAKDLPHLKPGDTVWVRDQACNGMVVRKIEYSRSYLVKTEKGGMLRRNRSALVIISIQKNPETVHSDVEDSEITQNTEVENEEILLTSNTETTFPCQQPQQSV